MGDAEGTMKKFIGSSANCFICSNSAVAREKIYIFGRSLVDLNRLVNLAVDINLSNDSENRQDLFVCRKQCYTKLLKLDGALNKVVNSKSETQDSSDFAIHCALQTRIILQSYIENSRAVKSLRFPEASS